VNEVNRVRLALPVRDVLSLLDGEDFLAVALPLVDVRVTGLQLEIDLPTGRLPAAVLEFDLPVDAVVAGRQLAKDLSGPSCNRSRLAHEDQILALVVQFPPGLPVNFVDPPLGLVRVEMQLDGVLNLNLVIAVARLSQISDRSGCQIRPVFQTL
jgi:hypothetical protein